MIQLFQRFRSLIDTGTGRNLDLIIKVMGIMGTVKIEVMGTGPDLFTVITDVRWFFKSVTKYRSKLTAVHGAAFGTAFKS